MWPWGHAAVGYLVYHVYCRYHRGERPQELPVVVLALGTQYPDLIDKPLAWTLDILPNGRSLGHSLFVVGVALTIVWYVASHFERESLATAFSTGVLTHLFGDALYPLVQGEFYYIGFLAWPLIPPVEYAGTQSILSHFRSIEPTSTVVFEFVLVLIAAVIWYWDRMPGVRTVLAAVSAR